jgi:hypothetical protein
VDNTAQYRSEDEQVNGMGLYRTLADGTDGLLIEREAFPLQPAYSITCPGDVATIAGAQLLMQFALLADNIHFGWTQENTSFAYTTPADRAAILAGADDTPASPTPILITGIGDLVTLQVDSNGTYCTHYWEVIQLSGGTPTDNDLFAWGTYNWEGINLYYTTSAGSIVESARFSGVGFHGFEQINNLVPPVSNVKSALASGVASTESTTDCFVTQRWETSDIENGLPSTIAGENQNSEDSQGRRATYRWEIDQQNIEQTWYWAYQDIAVDNDLGVEVELDNDVPVANNILSIFQEFAFLAGDIYNPHYLYWSKRFRPESFPVENFVEIGTAADPIKAHVPIVGVLGVFTSQTKYRVQGNATSGFIHDEAVSHRGAPAPRSVIPTDQGVMFVARDGVFVTNFIGADKKLSDAIDPIFLGDAKNGYDAINFDAVDQICAAYFKNKYYFSYPSGTNTTNDMTAIYSLDTEGWTFWGTGYASFYAEKDTNFFLAGGYDGIVRIIEDQRNASDIGAGIEFELQTHDFTTEGRNLFTHFIIDAECQDDTVTAEFYADNALIRSKDITGSRSNTLISLPTDSFGYKWRMRVSYTGTRRIAVYGVTAIYIPLMAA